MTPLPPEPPDLLEAEPHPFDVPDIPAMVRDMRTDVERSLIRQVVHDPDASRALTICEPGDFRRGAHRAMWETMRQLDADRTPIDLLRVSDALHASGRFVDIGGWDGLLDLCSSMDYLAGAVLLAEHLADVARRERLAAAGLRIANLTREGDVDLAEVQQLLTPQLAEHDRGIETAWDVVDEVMDRHAHPDREAGQRLGWRDLDNIYRPAPGMLSIVTGIPGSGKSSFVDAVGVRLAERDGWRFAVFSPESAPTSRHILNLVGIHAGINATRLEPGQVHEQLDWINAHFTWIRSTDAVTLTDVIRRADIIRRRDGIDGLVIDPWNELDHTRPDGVTETQHISDSLTRLRRWARRHGVHIWLVAHPKKQERRTDGTYNPPGLYEITGSATWNDKADMGVVVHRDRLNPGPADVHVVKVRERAQGRIGKATLHFDIASGRFHDAAPAWMGEPA